MVVLQHIAMCFLVCLFSVLPSYPRQKIPKVAYFGIKIIELGRNMTDT